jgi:uncharacterized spore protein YtfJ
MNAQESIGIRPLEKMLDRLSADTIFGRPTGEGETTVIPVAAVNLAFGYGYGSGRGPKGKERKEETNSGEGEGGGGGGRASITPQGFIRIDSDDVLFEPILDQTKLGLAGIAMGAWAVFWVTKTVRTFLRKGASRNSGE